MRIHLGHHFYGAGNLGDDFMLGGYLAAMASLAPEATFTLSTPFPLEPMRRRFPQIRWLGYTPEERVAAIAACDAWVGLGGSPFQCAQSRWFIDHLMTEAAWCRDGGKPMYFLGVGVQEESETRTPEIRAICAQAAGIWTRDAASATRLGRIAADAPVRAAADLAHAWFQEHRPPAPLPGQICLVANFDYRGWENAPEFLAAAEALNPRRRIWLAQEARSLPGAEKTLHGGLDAAERLRWELVQADQPGETLTTVTQQLPLGEWLLTSRYHAAIAGAWAGAKVVVIATNEKLRGVAEELGLPAVPAEANRQTVAAALAAARVVAPPQASADKARVAMRELLAGVPRRRA